MMSRMKSFAVLLVLNVLALSAAKAQTPEGGRGLFEARCIACHGGDGAGGEHGPAIVSRIGALSDSDLATTVGGGLPLSGMPAFKLTAPEMDELIAYLRTLRPRPNHGLASRAVDMVDGRKLEGAILNETIEDLQLQTPDQRVHLLRKTDSKYREVTSQTDWPSYNGDTRGSRYSPLTQVNRSNVRKLAPKWEVALPHTAPLEGTPVVVGGIMYMTSANECYALDAGTGRQIWHYQRPRTRNLTGNAGGGINRGVALAGDRVFMVTDNAHIIALNRFTGDLLWETEMADWHLNYNATSAPLIVGDLVVNGSSGGDEGVRGFLAAFDQKTGKEVWRFWTVPKPGEPGSETWQGSEIQQPGSVAWFTGSYDPELNTVYWQTGNPGNDLNGDRRAGDNLYSCSVLALDAKTGKLKWYYQFTPHDVWDWDATEPLALVDSVWEGQARKLLVQANRNGFLYVLDRTNGKLLLAKPFVSKLTWAKEIDADGRPVRIPNMEPTTSGKVICPGLEGASNWFSTSFNPATGLYYVQTLEKCEVFTKIPMEWKAGSGFMGGSWVDEPGQPGRKILRAFDIKSGKRVWELPEPGPAVSWGGTISTAGGIVIFGEDSGALAAADAATGKLLWRYQTNQNWKASPMTYVFDGKQYIAVASGSNVISFALVE
jgi:alcohol dehydrogenase (cytochrome c)